MAAAERYASASAGCRCQRCRFAAMLMMPLHFAMIRQLSPLRFISCHAFYLCRLLRATPPPMRDAAMMHITPCRAMRCC